MGKKIAFIVLDLDYGGLQKVVTHLILNIDRTRYNSVVFCLDRGGLNLNDLESIGIPCFILNRKPVKFDFMLFLKLVKLLKKSKVNLIHANSGCAFYAALASLVTRIPAVFTDHGRPVINEKRSRLLEDKLASIIFKKYISVSKSLTDFLINHLKINKNKIITIFNGVDTNKFKPRSFKEKSALRRTFGIGENQIVLGYIGRFDPIKNLTFLIDIIKKLKTTGSNKIKLFLVGDGHDRQRLEIYTESNNLKDSIVFTGYQSDTNTMLSLFDIFILPSLSEGFSIALLEAMASGLPVIASNVGDNSVLVRSNINGLICECNDYECFLNAISQMSNDNKYRLELGKKSRNLTIREFSLAKMIQEYQNLYEIISN